MKSAAIRLTAPLLASAALGIGLASSAIAQNQPESSATLPQQNCLLQIVNICKADGSCTRTDTLHGQKLPARVTVDFAAGIIAGVDQGGWVDATRIAAVARTPEQLVLQGIDNNVGWQLLIHQGTEAMTLSLAAPDGATIGFGTCTMIKEQVAAAPATP
jgi:hypothetical protein